MSETLTIRLPDDLAAWLNERARVTGLAKSKIVREELERLSQAKEEPAFMKMAGKVDGPEDLSQRKGYSR